MSEENASRSEAADYPAFLLAIVGAMLAPPLELFLGLLGWLSVLLPLAWLGLWASGKEEHWYLAARWAGEGAILLAVVQLGLQERRVWAGQHSRRLFYLWALSSPGVMLFLSVVLLQPLILEEPIGLSWLPAVGLLAPKTFRRLAMLFVDGIGAGWVMATGATAILLSGALVLGAVRAGEELIATHREESELSEDFEANDRERMKAAFEQRKLSNEEGNEARKRAKRKKALPWQFLLGGEVVIAYAVLAGGLTAALVGASAPARNAFPHFRVIRRLRRLTRDCEATGFSSSDVASSASEAGSSATGR